MARDQSIDPAAMKWAGNMCKRSQDEKLIRLMASVIEPLPVVRMMTLPAASWAFEDRLLSVFDDRRFLFTGVEQDPGAHHEMVCAAEPRKSNPLAEYTTVHGNTSVALTMSKEPYDIIYFDYMGTWSQAKIADIHMIAENRLATGMLVLTIMLRRGRPQTNDDVREFALNARKDWFGFMSVATRSPLPPHQISHQKILGVPEHVEHIFHQAGASCRCCGGVVYDNWSHKAPNTYTTEMSVAFDLREPDA